MANVRDILGPVLADQDYGKAVERFRQLQAELRDAEFEVKDRERAIARIFLDPEHPDFQKLCDSPNLHLVGRQIMQLRR